MDREDMLTKISSIAMDIADAEDVVLTNEPQPKDFEDRDSLNHIHILIGIEQEFIITFTNY